MDVVPIPEPWQPVVRSADARDLALASYTRGQHDLVDTMQASLSRVFGDTELTAAFSRMLAAVKATLPPCTRLPGETEA